MKNKKNSNWVSASDIGRASFCPHYLELKNNGAKPTQYAQKARARGELMHERINEKAQDKRCFIASHLYGVDDSRTCLLRSFRDEKLLHYPGGQWFIQTYYWLSPGLIRLSRSFPILEKIIKSVVDKIVAKINIRQDT